MANLKLFVQQAVIILHLKNEKNLITGDIGIVTFETRYSHGDEVQIGPVNFEDVIYERSLDGGISLEGDVAKKLFTLFTKELENDSHGLK